MKKNKIINYIAKNKLVKYVQAIEISCFLVSGFLLNHKLFEAGVIFFIGIVSALFASESAIEEYKLKESVFNGTNWNIKFIKKN